RARRRLNHLAIPSVNILTEGTSMSPQGGGSQQGLTGVRLCIMMSRRSFPRIPTTNTHRHMETLDARVHHSTSNRRTSGQHAVREHRTGDAGPSPHSGRARTELPVATDHAEHAARSRP